MAIESMAAWLAALWHRKCMYQAYEKLVSAKMAARKRRKRRHQYRVAVVIMARRNSESAGGNERSAVAWRRNGVVVGKPRKQARKSAAAKAMAHKQYGLRKRRKAYQSLKAYNKRHNGVMAWRQSGGEDNAAVSRGKESNGGIKCLAENAVPGGCADRAV